MSGCRHFFRDHWIAGMAVVIIALLTRMAVPTGYMPVSENGHIAITICGEQNPGMADMSAMPSMTHMADMLMDRDHSKNHNAPEHEKSGLCGFGGLSLTSLAAADPVLLALAILFIVVTLYRQPQSPRVAAARYLWPPRTGPPATF